MVATDDMISKPVKALYDALNRSNLNEIIDQFSEDAELIDFPSNSIIRGRQGIYNYFQNWMKAFSEPKGEITNLITADDLVIIEVTGRGTHQSVFSISYGNIPPSGEMTEVRFCQIYQIQNGKIKYGKSYYDLLGIVHSADIARMKSA